MGQIVIDTDKESITREGTVLREDTFDAAITLMEVVYKEMKQDPDATEELIKELENLIINSVKDIFDHE